MSSGEDLKRAVLKHMEVEDRVPSPSQRETNKQAEKFERLQVVEIPEFKDVKVGQQKSERLAEIESKLRTLEDIIEAWQSKLGTREDKTAKQKIAKAEKERMQFADELKKLEKAKRDETEKLVKEGRGRRRTRKLIGRNKALARKRRSLHGKARACS